MSSTNTPPADVYHSKCVCGAVHFSVDVSQQRFNWYCHCRACGRAHGASPIHLLAVPADNLTITKGEENLTVGKGHGNLTHAFCKQCGSGVYQAPQQADFRVSFPCTYGIESGVDCKLPAHLNPKMHVNYENRVRDFNDGLPKHLVWPNAPPASNNGTPVTANAGKTEFIQLTPATAQSPATTMPLVGLGTWQAPAGQVEKAIVEALKAGYRHIDGAAVYGNEKEVGAALQTAFSEGIVKREELFVTSKLWNSEHAPENVEPALRQTLSDLGLEYLDLYLVHWPQAFKHVEGTKFPKDEDGNMIYDTESTHVATWRALQDCVDKGLVRHLGLSNFTKPQIQNILANSRIRPQVLQVEVHPFFQQHKLVDFAKEVGIVVTAYSPLGSGSKVDGHIVPLHPALAEIGKKYNVTAAQVALRMQVQRGIVVIPKSVKQERIVQNIDLDFELSDEDMHSLIALDKGIRTGWGGPTVDRNGEQRPRDEVHPWYPFKMLSNGQNDPDTF